MISDADYKTLKEFVGVVFVGPLLGGEQWVRLNKMKEAGLVSIEYTDKTPSIGPEYFPAPTSPKFNLCPLGKDAIAEYESHMKDQKAENKRRKFENYWNRGLAILALIISIIALLKQ